jgi:hypothetical protein
MVSTVIGPLYLRCPFYEAKLPGSESDVTNVRDNTEALEIIGVKSHIKYPSPIIVTCVAGCSLLRMTASSAEHKIWILGLWCSTFSHHSQDVAHISSLDILNLKCPSVKVGTFRRSMHLCCMTGVELSSPPGIVSQDSTCFLAMQQLHM